MLLMPVVLLVATTVTLLLLVATKWTAYGRGTVAPYRKYSWDFQARALDFVKSLGHDRAQTSPSLPLVFLC